MRTVKRQVLNLNPGKLSKVAELARLYADEKQYWLSELEKTEFRHLIKNQRKIRDAAVADKYKSTAGLQARMWKLALIDACETLDKYWQALFVDVKVQIRNRGKKEKNGFTEPMLHYAYWLLTGYKQFFECMDGLSPVPPFELDASLLPKVAGFVHRTVRKIRGNMPSVKLSRSFALDADCYTVFIEKDLITKFERQYISIMTNVRGQRLVLPLLGQTVIKGNIRIVVDGDAVAIHVSYDLGNLDETLSECVCAVDLGYTEVMVDTHGTRYGTKFGSIMTAVSDDRNELGAKRNKLRDLAKKYENSPSRKLQLKAKHIKRFNLGNVKWDRREKKAKESISREINTSINTLIKNQKPSVLVTEDLSHQFSYKNTKASNRKMSNWSRGVITNRIEFKTMAEGFRHKQVNSAYTSQTCPHCGFVDKNNRNGDKFCCLHCKLEGYADRIAAQNILFRYTDQEITLQSSVMQVESILKDRFKRHLEMDGMQDPSVTVSGRTSDTVIYKNNSKPRPWSQQEGIKRRKPDGPSKSEIK